MKFSSIFIVLIFLSGCDGEDATSFEKEDVYETASVYPLKLHGDFIDKFASKLCQKRKTCYPQSSLVNCTAGLPNHYGFPNWIGHPDGVMTFAQLKTFVASNEALYDLDAYNSCIAAIDAKPCFDPLMPFVYFDSDPEIYEALKFLFHINKQACTRIYLSPK